MRTIKLGCFSMAKLKRSMSAPIIPQCDPPEYKDGSYFLSYDLMHAGRPYAGFAVGDVTALACYKYVYDESKAYLEEKLKCLIKEE